MKDTGVPGVAVAVVYGDEVMFTKGYGVRSTKTKAPVDDTTVFQIASLSKPISGTIVSGLVGQGHLAWDDPVQKANPDFQLSDPWVSQHVTYADLFAMRAGIPGAAGNLLEAIGYDRDSILNRLRLIALNPFRDTYSYSNYSLTAGGVLAAKAAGMTWEQAAEKVLFGPAGMTSTSYEHSAYAAATDRADLHVKVDGKWQPLYTRMPDPQAPAGGVSSDITDMATWARVLLNEGKLGDQQLVAPDPLAEMVTPAITKRAPTAPAWQSSAYGLGINAGPDEYGNTRWNHSGAFSTGAGTTATFLPGLHVGIVVLTNAAPVGASEAIADSYMQLIETGAVTQDWDAIWGKRMAGVYGQPEDIGTPPAQPSPARDVSAYLGTYRNPYVGDFQIVRAGDGGLAIVEGPGKVTYPLTHFDGDSFTYAQAPELPDYLSKVTFTIGPDGTATAIDVSAWDELGWGSLTRT